MKQTTRKQIKETIKNIPPNKKEEYSFRIIQKIIEKYGHLETRHIYEALPDEIDTSQLIQRLQDNNKKFLIASQKNLEYKIQNLESIDIIIVPGRAFDEDNNRLGRGKGHYDKFLTQQKKACPAMAMV